MTTASLPINPAVNYQALKSELQNNPEALKDAAGVTLTQHATAGRYQDCANLLNTQGAVAGETLATGVLPVAAFQSRIVAPELMALTQAQRADLHDFLSEYESMFGGIPLNDPGTWNSIIPTYFPSTAAVQAGYTQNTYQQLQALKTRVCSRAEYLWGAGVTLIWQDIAQAWNWT